MIARVLAVEDITFGAALTADVTAGATTITVEDVTSFVAPGQLTINGDLIGYTATDEDTNTLTTEALPDDYVEGDFVYVYPLTITRVAWLVSSDEPDGEAMRARVPHSLWDRMPLGIRDIAAGEGESVSAVLWGHELVITDVRSRPPVVDGGYIEPSTLPPGATLTDGNPPASSPAPSVTGGPGFLVARWTAVANVDPVTYDVHVSESSGFTPDPSTLYAQTGSTSLIIRELPDGSPLAYSTTYYVKLVAKDADGSAAASAQDSGAMVAVGTGELEPDGIPPSSSPTPVVSGGPGYLYAKWEPVSNPDLVEYEVHVSINPAFVPSPSTLYTTVTGSSVFIHGDQPLLEGGPAIMDGTEVTDGGDADSIPVDTYDGGGA